MRRRDLIGFLGVAALEWPLAARTQQRVDRVRRIGVLMAVAEADPEGQARGSAFRQGLRELGWNEGENLHIEWRWTSGEAARLNEYAAELVGLAPDLLITSGTPGLAALRRVTNAIPIVFVIVNDPVGQGFVPSLAHPGGNITGFTFLDFPMLGKSMQLLKELVPGITRVALMFNPDVTPYYFKYLRSSSCSPIHRPAGPSCRGALSQ